MAAAPQTSVDQLRRVQYVQTITIVWMSAEAVLSLAAAWMARSPALLAFGGDSAVELISAGLVVWSFRSRQKNANRMAARLSGILLFVVSFFVLLTSAMALLGYSELSRSYLGIVVLLTAAVVMPWLAKQKRRLSAETGSAALRADAAESALCGYLSLIALAGLLVNAVWHVRWADPIAALVIVPLVVREGWEALRGKSCACY